MDEPCPHVLAVVLNWNAREETLACVESLLASDWPCLKTLVVDNGSREDITSAISDRFPDVSLIRNARNLGFTGGMNTGLRHALEVGADYVLLLNNDTIVDERMVSVLVQTAMEHPTAGMVCPLVLYRDRPDFILSAGLKCDLRRGYNGRPLGQGERNSGQFRGVREVDAPAGAAMLVPTRVIEEVGPLDDGLFLYGEDVDWAARMRSVGLRVLVASDARLWHGLSVSSGGAGSPAITYYLVRNSFVVSARHAPLRGLRALLRTAEILGANLIHARRAPEPLVNAQAVVAAWRDYILGHLGPAPAALHRPVGGGEHTD